MNIYNPYLIIPFVAWFVAHCIKFSLRALNGDVNVRYFYASGGMPSGHSATVLALATTALVHAGWSSPLFGVVAVIAVIVVYDSFGVRRSSGDQAVAINTILKKLPKDQKLSDLKLREVLGHTPSEVIVGSLLGITVALLMSISVWWPKVSL